MDRALPLSAGDYLILLGVSLYSNASGTRNEGSQNRSQDEGTEKFIRGLSITKSRSKILGVRIS
jgi:hypothetical protein